MAAGGVVEGFAFVFLEDGELGLVDGLEFFGGYAEHDGYDGVDFY